MGQVKWIFTPNEPSDWRRPEVFDHKPDYHDGDGTWQRVVIIPVEED